MSENRITKAYNKRIEELIDENLQLRNLAMAEAKEKEEWKQKAEEATKKLDDIKNMVEQFECN